MENNDIKRYDGISPLKIGLGGGLSLVFGGAIFFPKETSEILDNIIDVLGKVQKVATTVEKISESASNTSKNAQMIYNNAYQIGYEDFSKYKDFNFVN